MWSSLTNMAHPVAHDCGVWVWSETLMTMMKPWNLKHLLLKVIACTNYMHFTAPFSHKRNSLSGLWFLHENTAAYHFLFFSDSLHILTKHVCSLGGCCSLVWFILQMPLFSVSNWARLELQLLHMSLCWNLRKCQLLLTTVLHFSCLQPYK